MMQLTCISPGKKTTWALPLPAMSELLHRRTDPVDGLCSNRSFTRCCSYPGTVVSLSSRGGLSGRIPAVFPGRQSPGGSDDPAAALIALATAITVSLLTVRMLNMSSWSQQD